MILVALRAISLDGDQDTLGGIHNLKNQGDELRRQIQFAVPQPAEQAFPNVRDRLQLFEAQKTTRAFDRVDGPEDACQ